MEQTRATLLCLGLMTIVIVVSSAEADWECGPPCKCKWVSGKKNADCIRQNFTDIPSYLSSDLQALDLTGNHIRIVTYNAFSAVNLVNLHKLVLRECGIEAVHTDAFNGLKIVIELDLSFNNIKTLFPGTFVETQRLRVLLLNQNKLKTLDDGLFHDLTYLQKIVLSDNDLTRIGERTFRNLPGLQTLELNGNNLTSVKLATFDILPKLGSLELRDNPWNCNCVLKKFRDWTIHRKLYTKPTTCSQPASLAGKMWDEVSSDDFACRPKILTIGPQITFETARGDVELWCRASGIPRPQLSWVHRSRIINNSTRRHNSDRGYLIIAKNDWLNITIPDVTIGDKGEYVCMAKNPGGIVEKNVTLTVVGDSVGGKASTVSLPLALGLGITFLFLLLITLILCVWYCRKRRPTHDEKSAEVSSLEHHGMGEQEKSLITAINPVVKPPRRYEAPSVTSHGTEMTELNRTLLDNDSVFADGPGSVVSGVVGNGIDDERERATPDLDNDTLTHDTSYRQYPPDLLAFSGGRGASPTSQASTVPDSSRMMNQTSTPFGSPSGQYPTSFKTLPHNRSSSVTSSHYNSGVQVMPRHGYVTIPRRPRAPSWSSGPPTSPTTIEGIEPVYDNLGLRTTADGSSVLSLNKSPEPGAGSIMRRRPLPGTPTNHPIHNTIQRSTPNILQTSSPLDRSAPEGAPEWPTKLSDEMMENHIAEHPDDGGTLGRKVPPRPPPKPKKKSTNGPLYEDEGEDGTEV